MAENSPVERGEWFIGGDYTLSFLITDSDGQPQNMVGWTFKYVLRNEADVAKITKTDVSVVDGNGTNDKALVTILDTDTDALAPGPYQDVLRRQDSGYEQVLSYGTVYLTEE